MKKIRNVLVPTLLLAVATFIILYATAEGSFLYRGNTELRMSSYSDLTRVSSGGWDSHMSVTNHANNEQPVEVTVINEDGETIGANQLLVPGVGRQWMIPAFSGAYLVKAKAVQSDDISIITISERLAPSLGNILDGTVLFAVADAILIAAWGFVRKRYTLSIRLTRRDCEDGGRRSA